MNEKPINISRTSFLDSVIDGRLEDKGGLFGITGGNGTGKTLTLLNIAKREILEGRNVLFCLCDEGIVSIQRKLEFFKNLTLKKNAHEKKVKATLKMGFFSEPYGTDLNSVLEAHDEEKYDTIIIEGLDRMFVGKIKNLLTRMVLTEKTKKAKQVGWTTERARKNLTKAIQELSILIANENHERGKTGKPFRIVGTAQSNRSPNGYKQNLMNSSAISYASSVIIQLKKMDNHYSATTIKNRWGDSRNRDVKFVFET